VLTKLGLLFDPGKALSMTNKVLPRPEVNNQQYRLTIEP
jgi:hypothetical protein